MEVQPLSVKESSRGRVALRTSGCSEDITVGPWGLGHLCWQQQWRAMLWYLVYMITSLKT